MTQIVFVNIIEICFLMTYVVLTVTCRHEFNSAKCYGMVWLCILAYFLFYVWTGFIFVLEFQKLVQDCEHYLKEPVTSDESKGEADVTKQIS